MFKLQFSGLTPLSKTLPFGERWVRFDRKHITCQRFFTSSTILRMVPLPQRGRSTMVRASPPINPNLHLVYFKMDEKGETQSLSFHNTFRYIAISKSTI